MNEIKKILKTILDIITYFLIIILSLYLILTMYQKHILKSDLMKINNYYIFQIASSSMETNLHIGDYIVIEKTNDYSVGDIITFKDEGVYVTHRIHQVKENEVITKGDANSAFDEAVKKNDVVGELRFKAHILSFVVKYKYIIMYILISIFVLDAVVKKTKPEEKEELPQ